MEKKGLGLLREYRTSLVLINKLADIIIISASLYFSSIFGDYPWNPHFTLLAAVASILYVLIAIQNNLYASWRISSSWYESFTILKVWFFTALFLALLLFIIKLTGEYFRKVLFIWLITAPVCLILWRFLIRAFLRYSRRAGFNKRSAVIVGAGDLGIRLVKTIEDTSWTGLHVVGFFDDNKTSHDISSNIPVLGKIEQLPDYLRNHDIDYVYIALPLYAAKKITNIINECRTLGASLYVVPDLFIFELFHAKIERLGDIILVNFNPYIRWKIVFDLCFSILAILLSLPVMLVIAICIKFEDGGPIFYGHRRITSAGNEFKCLKFRTMFVDADKKLSEILANDPLARKEWGKTFKLKNDPRITKVGSFLRKTSLDELPQFFNVLRGEMSVVGARPIVEKELYDYYKESGGLYCSMKPGITGAWQVGKRSDTEDYNERIQLDTWYIQNYSLWLDLKIIFQTITSILHGKGAY